MGPHPAEGLWRGAQAGAQRWPLSPVPPGHLPLRHLRHGLGDARQAGGSRPGAPAAWPWPCLGLPSLTPCSRWEPGLALRWAHGGDLACSSARTGTPFPGRPVWSPVPTLRCQGRSWGPGPPSGSPRCSHMLVTSGPSTCLGPGRRGRPSGLVTGRLWEWIVMDSGVPREGGPRSGGGSGRLKDTARDLVGTGRQRAQVQGGQQRLRQGDGDRSHGPTPSSLKWGTEVTWSKRLGGPW